MSAVIKKAKKLKLVTRVNGGEKRQHRVDLRLTETERAKLVKKASATRRTITSIVAELIEKMK